LFRASGKWVRVFHNLHLFESSFTCSGLQASGLGSFIIFTCLNPVLLVPGFRQVGQRED
jgi:hypothetical protein